MSQINNNKKSQHQGELLHEIKELVSLRESWQLVTYYPQSAS